jgi:uridine kinase
MMPVWKKNIFVRVVQRRMQEENRTAEDILTEYPALTEEERQEILTAIVAQ